MAHVVYPQVDDRPAGYSKFWIGEYLREKLGYTGIVLSDDLGMHAAGFAGNILDRMQVSFEAGCDAVLVCQSGDVKELYSGLNNVKQSEETPLGSLRGRTSLTEAELATVSEWKHWQQSLELLEKSQWA
jgi:beta-N-acetylhexosaminidase